jgi:hypothetical protein
LNWTRLSIARARVVVVYTVVVASRSAAARVRPSVDPLARARIAYTT